MTQEERNQLLVELEMLKMLLDIRVQNWNLSFKSQKEAEEYINAILEEMNEIKNKLERHE